MPGLEKINSFLFTLFGLTKASKKAHILLIVLVHISAWMLVLFLPVLLYPMRINDNWFISREIIDKAILILLFYLHYYLLIPRFFEKRKYVVYSLLVLLAFSVYLTQHILIRYDNFVRRNGPFRALSIAGEHLAGTDNDLIHRGIPANDTAGFTNVAPVRDHILKIRDGYQQLVVGYTNRGDSITTIIPSYPIPEALIAGIPKGLLVMAFSNAISSFALLLLMGGFIRLAYSFIRNQNEKRLLENANLNAEVNFLKSQINPHFLFNTLNSIYAQAHSRSDNTEYSILKLSELLRYVLYDSGDEKVVLSKDIEYITNYIDLQRLRLSSKVTLNYTVTGDTGGKSIAPLLLITFIENAFKHGISYTERSIINIGIGIFEKTLTLSVINPVVEKDSFEPGGLGLKNVTRRLELSYPGQHQLTILRTDSLHNVNLKINL